MGIFNQYGLRKINICIMDLSNTYMQNLPNSNMFENIMLKDGIIDMSMQNSPHYEIAKLYFSKGENWLLENYKETRYFTMMTKYLKKKKVDVKKFMKLCKSIKKGYLRGRYKDEYPIVLNEPFAKTRYNKNVFCPGFEIFSGHHRIGILLTLKKRNKVLVAEDACKGSCYTRGKVHFGCI